MKLINQIINQYTTPEQRRSLKAVGNSTYPALMRLVIGGTINNARSFYNSNVKPVIKATQNINSKSTTRAGLDPNKPTELKAAPKGSIFKGDIQNAIINLGRLDERGASARQDLIMFLTSLGTPSYEAEALGKTIQALAKVKGAKAAVDLGRKLLTTSKVIPKLLTTAKAAPKLITAAERKQVTAEVRNLIAKSRTELVKTNPKAMKIINDGVNAFRAKYKESLDALDLIFDHQQKLYRVADQLPAAIRRTPQKQLSSADRKLLTDKYKELEDFLNKPDYAEISLEDYIKQSFSGDELMNLSEFTEKYLSPQKLLTTKKSTDDLDAAFSELLKDNGKKAKELFDDLDVKSKAEIPNVMKFIKEFGELLKASPKRIKGENVGAKFSGIDVYDMYQAFKQAGNKLIGLTKDQIKNHPILSLAYSSLGLMGAGGLAYVAGKKLFGKDDNLEKEIKAGIAYPGLEEELGEQYLVGQSGKKYHVVGNRAYDYSTGKPANIEQFLDDVTAKVNFDTQSINDQIKIKQDQLAQLEQAEQNGYQVNPQFRQGIINDIGRLQQDLSNLPTVNVNYRDPVLSFDENGDIEQQYKDNVVAPQQARQEYQQQIQQQQVDDQYNQIVNDIYNKVANAYQQDLDTYFTPDNLAIEYGKYMNQVFMGQAQPLSPERFAEISKAQYMHQLLPTIANQAQAQVQALMTGQKNVYDYLNKQQTLAETGRHNRATEGIDVYKAQSDVADKNIQRQQKNIELGLSANKQAQDYELGRGGLEVSRQNAETNRINARTRQEALPFQQAANIGEFMSGVSMGDVPINELTQSNPQLFQKVFPGPEQQQPGQPVTNQDKINLIQNYYRGQQ